LWAEEDPAAGTPSAAPPPAGWGPRPGTWVAGRLGDKTHVVVVVVVVVADGVVFSRSSTSTLYLCVPHKYRAENKYIKYIISSSSCGR